MEIYILDYRFSRTTVVDQYASMIWTERYASTGDFELDINPDVTPEGLFYQGAYLSISKSQRVMVVETTELKTAEDGTRTLNIKGVSLENVLNDRPNQRDFSIANAPAQTLELTNPPADIIRNLFNDICRNNTVIPSDNIPLLQPSNYSTPSTIPEPVESITVRADIDTLYNTIKSIADAYELGFRLIRVETNLSSYPAMLYFEVYTGFDRTTGQTRNAPVVFGADFDNLTDTTLLESSEQFKNVACVFAPNGSMIVHLDDSTASLNGFDKKLLLVNASDIDLASGADLNTALTQRGIEELRKANMVVGFDGKISTEESSYVYGRDYNLGDLIEQRSADRTVLVMRVTEQIFISDTNGEQSYPTFTTSTLITDGSWDSFAATIYWDSFTTQYWDDITTHGVNYPVSPGSWLSISNTTYWDSYSTEFWSNL